jgi:copper ion binding protein
MRAGLAAMLLCVALLLGCRSEARVMRVEIAVEGMTCESCVQGITHEVGRLEGVQSVEVDLASNTAVVMYAEGTVDPAKLEQTIEALGYGATPGSPVPGP